jgi:hypothetical protein
MSIFMLDKDPKLNVQMMGDKSLSQTMITAAVSLSTALRSLGSIEDCLTKSLAPTSPFNQWIAASRGNFDWVLQVAMEAGEEYMYRVEKVHGSFVNNIIPIHERQLRLLVPDGKPQLDQYPICMHEKFKLPGVVESYRNFYRANTVEKTYWTNREKPDWIK